MIAALVSFAHVKMENYWYFTERKPVETDCF